MSLLNQSKKNRGTPRRPQQLTLEALEDRCLLAVSIQAGTLEIVGGATSDYAFVWESNIGYETFVHVNLNGSITNHLKALLPKGVRFRGLAGDDYFNSAPASVVVRAVGGDGSDYLECGYGNDTLKADDGHDTLIGNAGNDSMDGLGGNDSMDGSAGTDTVYGSGGNDLMIGGSSADQLWGFDGHDTIDGGSGNDEVIGDGGDDSLQGGDGNDLLDGGYGDDTLSGGSKNDTLNGYAGNDRLLGDGGNDMLSGGGDDDALYGGDGGDDLRGEDGLDGLFAGLGLDTASGGSGADRFLTLDINGDDFGVWDYDWDDLTDVADEDAVIIFENDNAVWSDAEVQLVDGGFARMHALLGSTTLLKDPENTDTPLRFYRRIQDDDSPGNNGTNNGTSVLLYDVTFTSGANWVAFVTIHEIGHFWDESSENSFATEFRDLSHWTTKYGSADVGDVEFVGDVFGEGGTYFVKAEDDDWWYEGGSLFVTDYATTNPFDDFADTFTAVVMGDDFYRNSNDTPDAPKEKLDLIVKWLDNL